MGSDGNERWRIVTALTCPRSMVQITGEVAPRVGPGRPDVDVSVHDYVSGGGGFPHHFPIRAAAMDGPRRVAIDLEAEASMVRIDATSRRSCRPEMCATGEALAFWRAKREGASPPGRGRRLALDSAMTDNSANVG